MKKLIYNIALMGSVLYTSLTQAQVVLEALDAPVSTNSGGGNDNGRCVLNSEEASLYPECLMCYGDHKKVTLYTPNGIYTYFQCRDVYITDAAEYIDQMYGTMINLPLSDRTGNSSASAAKLISGSVDQRDQNFLDDNLIRDGWLLTDTARPITDVVIKTHMEHDLP